MPKGLIKHRERQDAINFLGKNLARRAKSKCELCMISGAPLTIHEVPPVQNEPKLEHCLMLCTTCKTQLDNPKLLDHNHWRCLIKSIWSQIPAVQVVSLRLLRLLVNQHAWAAETLEHTYLDASVEQWADLDN